MVHLPVEMSGSKAEVARVREALRSLIDLSGLSRREIEKRLSAQGSGVDLTRLLAGRFEIKLRHILDIAQVIDIHPLEFFRLTFKEPEERSPLLQRVEAVFAPGNLAAGGRRPRARPAAGDADDLPNRLKDLLREVERLLVAAGTDSRE
jgi:transcriptional regulator with XRE-family HTH domain